MKILTADFGSTFTKLTAIDTNTIEILGSSKSFTTIESNVMTGFNKALDQLKTTTGINKFDKILASSSAAGGLKMVSVGLVPDLTAKASTLAANSAGAKVIKSFSYELSRREILDIESIDPDIILLTGGIDGGNKNVILHNAKMLSKINSTFLLVYAGNKSALDEAEQFFVNTPIEFVPSENVMPVFNKLNIEPAKSVIRKLFIKNIISAKGLNHVSDLVDEEIIPTPLAIFNGARLLSKGTENLKGLGDLMVFDVGGATTDVYSMSDGDSDKPNTFLQGLKEPFAKRSVEGDIGMRYSILSLVDAVTPKKISMLSSESLDNITKWVDKCKLSPETIPFTRVEKNIDFTISKLAIDISAHRHCGILEKSFTPMGEVFLQFGKDLTNVKSLIGTGGSVINSPNPVEILQSCCFNGEYANSLRPVSPALYMDEKYIFSSMGLLSARYPDIALKLMLQEFIKYK